MTEQAFTDGDVEIAARAIFESVRHSGTRWEDLKPYPRENYRQMARAVLESVDAVPRAELERSFAATTDAAVRADQAEAALSEAVGRADSLASEVEELRGALVESHGSYESLRAAIRSAKTTSQREALYASSANWDGPICAKRALGSLRDREGGD